MSERNYFTLFVIGMSSRIFLFLLLLLTCASAHAQSKKAKPIVDVRTVIAYPTEELKAGVEGRILADLMVDTLGRVPKFKIKESTNKNFTQALTIACTKTMFEPARDSLGQKVMSWYPITIIFKPDPEQVRKANDDEVVDVAQMNDKMQGNSDPKALTNIDDLLEYPMPAIRKGLEGKVELYVIVNSKGTVDSCEVLSLTDPIFESAAINTMKKMKYKPLMKGGIPYSFRYKQTVAFSLGKK